METVLENSAVGESVSNGIVERGIRDIGGQVRVLKDAIEARYNNPARSTNATPRSTGKETLQGVSSTTH